MTTRYQLPGYQGIRGSVISLLGSLDLGVCRVLCVGRRIKHLCAISESGLRVTRGAVTSLLGPLDLGLVFVTQAIQIVTKKSVVVSRISEPRQTEKGPVD